ncbi:luciferin 4-monooxygenase-like isoform X2 [Leguminivora glycinivorella]|nr:luciferin 4-monooxygenase-like isoform X2 [Leguminivora glycinivorella]XP_048001009.1 luciferin 4-monooxygenase-like isoform X2 [Leguminivora glycinivorella]
MIHGEGDVMVPAHLNFGRFVLDRLRRATPDHICLRNCTTGEQLTFSEFTQYAVRLGAALAQLGVGRGDTVAVGGEPRVTFMPTGLAVVLAGAAYTPIPLSCGSATLTHKLNLTKPKYFICTRQFWEAHSTTLKSLEFINTFICFDDVEDIGLSVQELVSNQSHVDVDTFEPAVVNGDDMAVVLYSSGTTGMSKGVLITHLSCIARCDAQGWYGFDSFQTAYFAGDDQCGSYGIFPVYMFWCAGKTMVYSEDDVDLKIIQDYKVDVMPTVPGFAEELLSSKVEYDLSSLKIVYTGTAPLHLTTAKAFKERYPNIELLNIYGTTEAYLITAQGPSPIGTTTIGVATPGVTIKVVDTETRATLGPNQRGEICVKSPFLMKGYLGATSRYLDEQGFYLTGDLGYYDEEKMFYLDGRLHDIIVHHLGYKISPLELEEVLLSHPAVREAGVVGRPGEGESSPPPLWCCSLMLESRRPSCKTTWTQRLLGTCSSAVV